MWLCNHDRPWLHNVATSGNTAKGEDYRLSRAHKSSASYFRVFVFVALRA